MLSFPLDATCNVIVLAETINGSMANKAQSFMRALTPGPSKASTHDNAEIAAARTRGVRSGVSAERRQSFHPTSAALGRDAAYANRGNKSWSGHFSTASAARCNAESIAPSGKFL